LAGRRRRGIAVIGAGLQEQPHAFGVAVADRSGERLLGHLRQVRYTVEEQRKQLVAVVGEAGEVEVVVVGDRTVFEELPVKPPREPNR
jgi:hypothetical protein